MPLGMPGGINFRLSCGIPAPCERATNHFRGSAGPSRSRLRSRPCCAPKPQPFRHYILLHSSERPSMTRDGKFLRQRLQPAPVQRGRRQRRASEAPSAGFSFSQNTYREMSSNTARDKRLSSHDDYSRTTPSQTYQAGELCRCGHVKVSAQNRHKRTTKPSPHILSETLEIKG